MPTEQTIAARTHGRYLIQPGPRERLLVGFHGYGEIADVSLAQMLRIPGVDDWTVVAVQALHSFYLGRSETIGASWMTRQNRELHIADNIDYVRSVVTQFPVPRSLVFLGFSQGVAMAYRAAAAHHPQATGVIALAGDLPPDVTAALPPVLIGRGTEESWFTEEKLKENLKVLETFTTVRTCTFEGGHEWTEPFREAAGRFLREC